jgi:ferredoxin
VSQRDDEERRPRRRQLELRVNPITCQAHGVCIELVPELIAADPWGYPILRPGPVPHRLLAHARRAVANCPTLALLLTESAPGRRP